MKFGVSVKKFSVVPMDTVNQDGDVFSAKEIKITDVAMYVDIYDELTLRRVEFVSDLQKTTSIVFS